MRQKCKQSNQVESMMNCWGPSIPSDKWRSTRIINFLSAKCRYGLPSGTSVQPKMHFLFFSAALHHLARPNKLTDVTADNCRSNSIPVGRWRCKFDSCWFTLLAPSLDNSRIKFSAKLSNFLSNGAFHVGGWARPVNQMKIKAAAANEKFIGMSESDPQGPATRSIIQMSGPPPPPEKRKDAPTETSALTWRWKVKRLPSSFSLWRATPLICIHLLARCRQRGQMFLLVGPWAAQITRRRDGNLHDPAGIRNVIRIMRLPDQVTSRPLNG